MTDKQTSLCGCGQLWTTVDNPVDKPVQKSAHAMSLIKNQGFSLSSDIQQATLDALDLFSARLDALELRLEAIEALDYLRRFREGPA